MQITETLIQKFFDDACTPAEADAVAEYLKQNPEEMRKWLAADWDAASWAPDHQPRNLPKPYPFRWTIAAAAAAITIIAGIALLRTNTVRNSQSTARKTAPAPVNPDTAWTVTTNPSPLKKDIKLPDGSTVTLYTRSAIRYRGRVVVLQGQAGFDIAKDPVHAFIVKAGATTTTVLGTRFNVTENEQGVTVRLYQGKVSVRTAEKEFILIPGEQMRYDIAKNFAEKSPFGEEMASRLAPARASSPNEKLVFENTPLPEVIQRLVSHYHQSIDYDKQALSRMYFTGTVLPTDSIATILQVIANMNDLKVSAGKQGFILSVSPNK